MVAIQSMAASLTGLPAPDIGTLIYRDWQIEWRGLLLGDEVTTTWGELTGWDDLPGIDSGNTSRPSSAGAFAGRKLPQQRVVTFECSFVPGLDSWSDRLRALRQVTTPDNSSDEWPLVVRTRGETLACWGAVTGRVMPVNDLYVGGGASLTLQWECSDPLRYATAQRQLGLSIPPRSVTGLGYPLGYPLDYGAEQTVQSAGTALNAMDAASPPTVVFSGPVTNPGLVNLTTGMRIEFAITLSETDSLVIDCADGTATLNGSADRLTTRTARSVPLTLFRLAAEDNDVIFVAQSASPGNECSLYWRDATL